MLLVLDIGNSAMKAGLFDGGTLERTARLELSSAVSTRECVVLLEDFLTGAKTPLAVAVACVVPDALGAVAEAAESVTGVVPMVVTHDSDTGLVLDIKEPSTMGADRIVAAVGAVEAIGSPVAVVDFGTATTVGFVFEGDVPGSAVFRGGAIMPGLTLMGRLLSTETAQLPDVDFHRTFSALGRDTVENILSGVVLGTAGAVERIIAEVERMEAVGFQMVLTGGMCAHVRGHLARTPVLVEPNLTLYGLRAIYSRCRASA